MLVDILGDILVDILRKQWIGCFESEVIFMFVGIFGDIFWDIVKK